MASRGTNAIVQAWGRLIESGFESNECGLLVFETARYPRLEGARVFAEDRGVGASGMPIRLDCMYADDAASPLIARALGVVSKPSSDPIAILRDGDTFCVCRCKDAGLAISVLLRPDMDHPASDALHGVLEYVISEVRADVLAYANSMKTDPREIAAMVTVIRDMDSMKTMPIVPIERYGTVPVELSVGRRAAMADRIRPFSKLAATQIEEHTSSSFGVVCCGFGMMTVHEINL